MELVTGRQMASIDRRAIASGIPGQGLMERAGLAVFDAVVERLREGVGRRVSVVCGKGNNGGDGFVASRLLHAAGYPVETFLIGRMGEVGGDAGVHLSRARSRGVEVREILQEEEVSHLGESLVGSDLIVDAILGTGLKGAARATSARAIEVINASGRPVVAVDVPSGLDADTGRVHGPCIRADLTISFALPRIGHFFHPGRVACGTLRVADIGIPRSAVEAEGISVFLITGGEARGWFPRRSPEAHKGDCGRVSVLAGSEGMTGAAALCAAAAVRSGAGLVTLGVPSSLNDILETKLTEAMTVPLPEVRRHRCLSVRARGSILRMVERADVVALGPGLGMYRETAELVRRLIVDLPIPLVLDADGLNALGGKAGLLRSRPASTVITPHPGEFGRLTGASVPSIQTDPIGNARSFAVAHGVVVVLKGAPTVVADPSGSVWVNPTGNSGMATGGAGDVLTGLVAALVGQGLRPDLGARLGVYIHGAAGDLVRDRRGEMGMTAGDLVEVLPETLLGVADGTLMCPYFKAA